jgi:hypothetical protein
MQNKSCFARLFVPDINHCQQFEWWGKKACRIDLLIFALDRSMKSSAVGEIVNYVLDCQCWGKVWITSGNSLLSRFLYLKRGLLSGATRNLTSSIKLLHKTCNGYVSLDPPPPHLFRQTHRDKNHETIISLDWSLHNLEWQSVIQYCRRFHDCETWYCKFWLHTLRNKGCSGVFHQHV